MSYTTKLGLITSAAVGLLVLHGGCGSEDEASGSAGFESGDVPPVEVDDDGAPAASASAGEDDDGASGAKSSAGGDGGQAEGDGTPAPGEGEGEADSAGADDNAGESEGGDESGGEVIDVGDDNVVSFIAMGDGGEGNDGQYAVGAAVEEVCSERECGFVLYLGDNFYDVGVETAMDTQFTDKFEMPYADLDLPFMIALGNHDYGALGNQFIKGQYQIEYTEFSDTWTLPDTYYAFDEAHVTFVGLDTAALFWDEGTADQRVFLQETLETTDSRWVVAFGHHPYVSNGAHGNAGNYEGLGIVPIVSGNTVKEFFDAEVCDKVTVYFSGHDHNRQWHPQRCGTEFIVSGAASKTKGFDHRDDNPQVYWEDATRPGFAWVEIRDDEMTVAFYNDEAQLDFERTITLGL